LERDDDEEAMEPRVSLLPVDDEKVDAIESRDRHDEPDEDVVVELAVLVDMNDEAVELRRESIACENIL
jgi:tryptophanyl-tRNA synthetase